MPLASLMPIAVIEAQPIVTPVSPVFEGLVTHYGIQYNGSRMGCVGEPYSSDNETIIAVGPWDAAEWPCGTQLRVCGQSGCVVGHRQDSCPGCGSFHLDLSEAGIARVCGDQAQVCRVGIEEVVIELPLPELPARGVQVIFRDPPIPVTVELEPVRVPAPEVRTALAPVP